METNPPLLQINQLNVFYGGINALHDVDIHVGEGEIVAVIGANGAGKSTLLKTIAGVKAASSGTILYQGAALPKQTFGIVQKGIMLVPEGRRILAPMTVKENLMLGAYTRTQPKEILESLEIVYGLFPVLKERIDQKAGTLSGGEQQMLAVSRALMSKPKLLLLDEPSLGLAPIITDTLFQKIIQLNQTMGLTILLVEQNASLALEISHRAYVLETGRVKMDGLGKDLLQDERVKESYLGIVKG
jgi:branched-chain amino acid transport system ATP-binding protein